MCQLIYILCKLRLLDVHGLIRTPGRNHHRIVVGLVLGILNVVVQIVYRIISGADTLHVIVTHQTTGRELRLQQFLITLVKDLSGGLG